MGGKFIADGAQFKCMFATGKVKISVSSSCFKSESKKIATESNYTFGPQTCQCTVIPSAPAPCKPPSVSTLYAGQTKLKIEGNHALNEKCQLMCGKGGVLNVSYPGQSTAQITKKGRAKRASPAVSKEDKEAIANYFVYQILNDKKEVIYVGITNEPERRGDEHQKEKGTPRPVTINKIGMTKKEARNVEQALIEHYGRVKNKKGELLGGKLYNEINSISPKQSDYAQRVQMGMDYLKNNGILDTYPSLNGVFLILIKPSQIL